MYSLRLVLAISFLLLMTSASRAQVRYETSSLNLQYGYSLKVMLELGKYPILHVAANGGVASNFIAHQIYPSINTEFLLYSGGLGTGKPILKQKWFTFDFILATTLTVGIGENKFNSANQSTLYRQNIPLYYFTNFTYPSLVNPFNRSISLGTNIIWSSTRFPQRIGFINIHPYKELQISYYNDGGPPMDFLYAGDRQDRYYTGGGLISYHGPVYTLANLVELGYHKFTGYTKNSYQVAKRLNQAYVNYSDTTQIKFNRSLWSLNVANPGKHVGINIREYNRTTWDMQHKIHWGGYSPYHLVPHPRTWSVSGQYYYTQTYLGLR